MTLEYSEDDLPQSQTAHLEMVGGRPEEATNVARVEFTPTHVVIHHCDGELVAFLASDVKTIVTVNS